MEALAEPYTEKYTGIIGDIRLKVPYGKIVVERCAAEGYSGGGIIIPDKYKKKPQEGIVRCVGPGRRATKTGVRIDMEIQVGDHVLFEGYQGTQIGLGGRNFMFLEDTDILGVFDPD